MIVAVVLFWVSLVALAWTHVIYPLLAIVAARASKRRIVAAESLPSVTVIVAAHDEESVIERRVANLLALDYPREKLEIVVTSDASTDRTEELAEAAGARVIRNPRGGKVAAQDRAVRETESRDRRLLRRQRDLGARRAAPPRRARSPIPASPTSAGSCASRRPTARTGRALYWRYEMAVRAAESALGSVTGGNGSIYAVRRSGLRRGRPALRPRSLAPVPDGAARQARGLRAGGRGVREADAVERERVPPQGAHVRALLADRAPREGCCAGSRSATSSRSSRTATCATRAGCCTSFCSRRSLALVTQGWFYDVVLAGQVVLLAAAAAGVGIARYYVLVTWATVVSLWNYLRRGVPATWEAAEGTR